MNERIGRPARSKGLSAQTLRTWGILFLVTGIAGYVLIQKKMLGVGSVSEEQLFTAMDDPNTMIYATVALVAQLVQTFATPIFCFLLAEGMKHTSSFRNYFLRVAGVALVSEIPYDLVMYDKVFDWSSQNPVLGLVLSMAVIYLMKRYCDRSFKGFVIGLMLVVMGMFWTCILWISDGLIVFTVVLTLWGLRSKPALRLFAACAVIFLCASLWSFQVIVLPLRVTTSMLYIVTPMVFLAVHFYNGERGEGNRWVNYLAYPVMLMGVWLIATFAF